jgi:hypothetical protein
MILMPLWRRSRVVQLTDLLINNMASTKVVQTDISDKAKKTLLANVVRHAVATVAGTA